MKLTSLLFILSIRVDGKNASNPSTSPPSKKYVKHLNYLKIINKLLPQRRQTDSVFYELYTFTYEPASKLAGVVYVLTKGL